MKNSKRILSVFFVLALAVLACTLPGNQPVPVVNNEEITMEITNTVGAVVTDTAQPVTSETFTPIPTYTPITPTATATSTFTPVPPTSTFTPSPTATSTYTPTFEFNPVVVFPVFTGSTSGFVYFDLNHNGVLNPELGELPAKSANARIYKGACPGTELLFQATSAANGTFSKTDLPIGTYCVAVFPNGAKWGGNYIPTIPNPAQRTVEVKANETTSAGIFGFRPN